MHLPPPESLTRRVGAMKSAAVTGVWITFLLLAAGGCEGPRGVVGPQGDPGPTGDAGVNGTDGAVGQDGQNGLDGTDGQAGTPGRNVYLTGPGLVITLLDVQLAGNVATATFKITDGAGVPLDRTGTYTEGAVAPRFLIGRLEGGTATYPGQYVSYVEKSVAAQPPYDANPSLTQASTDSGGTFSEVGEGEGTYTYQFNTPVTPPDPSVTHTVGVYASRSFEGESYVSNDVFHFVPDGSPVTVTREVVKTSACNQCHNPLALHGGSRRETSLCIMCHTPQSGDPESGNTVDFKVMVHKIHRGADLPTVKAGGTYEIIGHNGNKHDFSTVEFPQDLRNCDTCHTGADGGLAQSHPSRAACGSCHDNVNFATGVISPGTVIEGSSCTPATVQADCTMIATVADCNMDANPDPVFGRCERIAHSVQSSDVNCSLCHPASGTDLSVTTVHAQPSRDPARPVLTLTIDGVTLAAGALPQVSFTVAVDGAPYDISSTPLYSLGITVAGPTTDYSWFGRGEVQGSSANGALAPVTDGSDGRFAYTFPAGQEMPSPAEGTYAVAMDARLRQNGVDYAAANPIHYEALSGTLLPRRQVVDRNLCNRCHFELGGHGGQRTNVQYCVMCHNPNNTNDERVANWEVDGLGNPFTTLAEPVDFKVMIHKIHRGEDLTQPYVLGGYPTPSTTNPEGTPVNFGETRFPGDLRDCETCHLGPKSDPDLKPTYALPLGSNVLPTRFEELTCTEAAGADGDDFCNTRSSNEWFLPPTTAVCTACHDSPYTAAHAEIMTTGGGVESCATCHGPGKDFDVLTEHKPAP